MKTIKCIITSNAIGIGGVKMAIDPPLSAEDFSDDMELLRVSAEELNDQRVKEIGFKLFQRVFAGSAQDQYQSSSQAALALAVDDDLSVLPWELLHDGTDWTARTRGIIRILTTDREAPEFLPKPGALRILAAVSGPLLHDDENLPDDDPQQPHPVDVDAHADIFRRLAGEKFPSEIKIRRHATREAIAREVGDNYHVFHFVGHGNIGKLVFETRHGTSDPADESWIGEQMAAALRGGLRLAVINSCFSADALNGVSGIAANIMETGVPAVIAMRGSISEHADIAFTKSLYADLAGGKPIDEAIMNVRRVMAADWQIKPWEWATPVLFINESLLERDEPLSIMDAEMAEMMAEPKARVVEPPRASLDPMMTREENFVGRRRELSDALRSLDPDSRESTKLVCLDGEAGVGKTAIAIEAAHRMAEWSDEIAWLPAHTFPPDELKEHVKGDDPLARIGGEQGFLITLAHKCGFRPQGDGDMSRMRNDLLRSLNDGRRRLLVLDGVEKFAGSPLIKSLLVNLPLNCKALITSRRSLEINEKQIHVSPMNSRDAGSLLASYSKLKELKLRPEQMDEIIHVTAGHPMAMRLLVSQVIGAEKTLDVALKGLQEAEGTLFEYIFKRSLKLAGNDCRKVFGAMAIFLPTAGRKALQSACGMSGDSFDKAVERIVELSLVDAYDQGKRFGLHQLSRAHAQQELRNDRDSDRYRERAARFFMDFVNATVPMTQVSTAAEALSAQMPIGALGKQMIQNAAVEILVKPAVEMLERDLINCLIAQEWLLNKGKMDESARLYNALSDFLVEQGYRDIAIGYLERAAEGWKNRGDHHAETIARRNLGMMYQSQGKWDEAAQYYGIALQAARESEDEELEAHTLSGLGTVYGERGKWDEAIEYLGSARELFQHRGDEKEEAGVLNNLGIIYLHTGQREEAVKSFEKVREVSERVGEKLMEASSLRNLGDCYRMEQKSEDSLKCYETALDLYKELNDIEGQANVLGSLGSLLRDLSNLELAVQYYAAALRIRNDTGDRSGQQIILNDIAIAYSQQGKWTQSAGACVESFQIATQIHASMVMDSLRVILRVSKSMLDGGEFAAPAQLAKRASMIIQSVGVVSEEMRAALAICHGIFTIIGFMAACEGNRKSDVYKEALELARSLDERTGMALKLVEWLENGGDKDG